MPGLTAFVQPSRSAPRPSRAMALAVAGVTALAAIAGLSAPAAAGGGLTYNVVIGSCRVFIADGPADKRVRFELKNRNGKVKAVRTVTMSDNGSVEIDCLARVAVGDRFAARRTNGQALRGFSVPRVTMALRRDTNKAGGVAPAGRDARLISDPCDPSESLKEPCSLSQHQKDFVIPGNGTWSKSAAGADFDPTGGDGATLFLFSSHGDRTTVNDRANTVHVQPGSAEAKGIANPGATVTIQFKNGSTVRGSGTSKADPITGFFKVKVRKPNGDLVPLALGNRVAATVAADSTFIVDSDLDLDLSDALNDHVQGTCYPDRRFEVRATLGDVANSVLGDADGTGAVDVQDLVSGPSIPTGTTIALWCETDTGDWVELEVVLA